MRGRALFKLDGTLRSEIERDVKGFRSVRYSPSHHTLAPEHLSRCVRVLSSVDVFQETSQVHVSNVRTHSDKDYVAGPVRRRKEPPAAAAPLWDENA